MKKNLFLIGALLVGMTMATGCSNEEVLEQNQGNLTVVKATIDNGSVARTSVNELYQVVWSEGDSFTVFRGETSNGDMTLQGQGGATTGDFSGALSLGLAEGDVALFPAVGEAATMTYTFKNAYTDTETDAPLYGTYNGTSFTFSPLSAVVRVNASGLTAGTQYVLTITSTGDEVLTGVATLGNNNALVPTGDGKAITVTLTPVQGVTSLTFDAPIPAQIYTGLNITLKAGDAEVTTLKTLANFEAEVGKLYEATTKVNSSDALKAALVNGGNIDLDASFSLSENMTVSENTIIDLNNQTLTATGYSITVKEGKTLTIQNAASLGRSAATPSIISDKDIIVAESNSTIIIGEGVNLESTANCCIFVPAYKENVTITTSGNLKTSGGRYATIYVNGTDATATITVNGGSIEHVSNTAMYLAGETDLTINDGAITGTTGVEMRAGELTINGGTIEGTGDPFTASENGNGSTTIGAAVAIAQHTTNKDLKATINEGTFTGVRALYEEDLENEESENISLSVTGGTFNGQVISENCTNFITGGTFSDASAFDYLADNADVKLGAEMIITKPVTISDGISATIDLNGKSIENKTAGHPSEITPNVDDECVVFMVTEGKLTIQGSGDVKATGDGQNSDYNVAVWAMGSTAEVVISGGSYSNNKGIGEDGCDLIYARDGASITINGGSFQSHIRTTLGGGIYDVLDCKDNTDSKIVVEGGQFQNYVPSFENVGSNEVVLGTNKNVYIKGTTTKVTTAHNTSAENTWYEVK